MLLLLLLLLQLLLEEPGVAAAALADDTSAINSEDAPVAVKGAERLPGGNKGLFLASASVPVPAVVLALEAPDAIGQWRKLMGSTDPAQADEGTLRRQFGSSIERNATHGSDAPETAAFELSYFFRGMELD